MKCNVGTGAIAALSIEARLAALATDVGNETVDSVPKVKPLSDEKQNPGESDNIDAIEARLAALSNL